MNILKRLKSVIKKKSQLVNENALSKIDTSLVYIPKLG